MNEIIGLLTTQDMQRVGILALLIFVNWASASLCALAAGKFDIKKFPQFFTRDFLPYVLGFALMQATMHAGLALSNLATAAISKDTVTEAWTKIWDGAQLYGVFGMLVMRYGLSAVKNFGVLFSTVATKVQALAK